jgi:hypothetical protein
MPHAGNSPEDNDIESYNKMSLTVVVPRNAIRAA